MPADAPLVPSAPAKRRWRAAWIALALALVVVAITTAWTLRPPTVKVVALEPATLVRTLGFSARVATVSRVDVGATITGRVLRVAAVEGAPVRAGQVLIELEEDELQAVLRQAQASQAQSVATLRNAGEELQRVQALVTQGFVTASRADDARRAVDVAQAQVSAAAAATAVARARLAQARIVAPTAARVLARHVEPGQIVQAGKPLVTLALASATQLVASVDERFLEQLQLGQRADVVADAFPQQRFSARLVALAPAVDPQRGAVEVRFNLEGEVPPILREDLTVSVEVETGRRERVLVLPLAALREDDLVWVVNESRLEVRPVRLGLRTLQAAEVLEGLAAGDRVALGDNADSAQPGQRVRSHAVSWALAASVPTPSSGGSESAIGNAMRR